MAHSSSTTHYSLPQFATTDKPAWLTDFNGAMSAIDTGIYNAQDAADDAQSDATQALSDASDAATAASAADAKGAGSVASIAPTFDPTSTYQVGSYVMYNSLLYRCTTAITTPGPWSGVTNWTRTTVNEMVAAVQAQIPTNLEYKVGDTVTISGVFTGFITGGKKEITFHIPFNKPLASNINNINFSGGWNIRDVSGQYLSNNVPLSSLGTVSLFSKSATGAVIQVIASEEFSTINNTPVAIQARANVTATFATV